MRKPYGMDADEWTKILDEKEKKFLRLLNMGTVEAKTLRDFVAHYTRIAESLTKEVQALNAQLQRGENLLRELSKASAAVSLVGRVQTAMDALDAIIEKRISIKQV